MGRWGIGLKRAGLAAKLAVAAQYGLLFAIFAA